MDGVRTAVLTIWSGYLSARDGGTSAARKAAWRATAATLRCAYGPSLTEETVQAMVREMVLAWTVGARGHDRPAMGERGHPTVADVQRTIIPVADALRIMPEAELSAILRAFHEEQAGAVVIGTGDGEERSVDCCDEGVHTWTWCNADWVFWCTSCGATRETPPPDWPFRPLEDGS